MKVVRKGFEEKKKSDLGYKIEREWVGKERYILSGGKQTRR